MGASEKTKTSARRDGPTSQGRPSDMPASVLHQVRQQQGILQRMPQMRPEVQVGSKSRRMGAFPPPSSSNILPIMDAPVKGKGKTSSRATTSKAMARPPAQTQMVHLPEFDPEAYPVDSGNGEDGYHGWGVPMDVRDVA